MHARDLHVVDAGFRLVATEPDVVVSVRLDAVLLGRLARDGVQRDLGVETILVDPDLCTGAKIEPEVVVVARLGQLDDVRPLPAQLGGQSVGPDVGLLDDVVVDRDEVHVVGQGHRRPPTSSATASTTSSGRAPDRGEPVTRKISVLIA